MYKNINKKLIIRLGFAWLFVSAVIGTAVFFLEHKKIDEFLFNLARDETQKITAIDPQHLNNPVYLKTINQKYENSFNNSRFIIIKLYNKEKTEILTFSKTEADVIQDKIKSPGKYLPPGVVLKYEKIHINVEMFIHVSYPIKFDNKETGYFDGVYHVESRIMSDINQRVLFSLILIIFTVLMASIVFYPIVINLNRGLIKYSQDLTNSNVGMLMVLGSAIAKRDSDTNIHNYRVTLYTIKLGEAIGLKNSELRELIKGAFLHDIGKIAISDAILLKPGKLTDSEYEIMKTHVKHGEDIIKDYSWLNKADLIVRYHHEKFDGSGYLNGLKRDEIPLNARIFAVSDVFDALTSKRPYKESFTLEKSISILEEGRGTHFDPVVLDAFSKIAQSLYLNFSYADEKYLKNYLWKLLSAYFSLGISNND